MWIVRLALRRPYTFVMMSMLIVLLGAVTILRMPTDIFPEINIPVVSIIWNYNGLSAQEMGQRIAAQKKGSITLAPEAGSQRMRDVINKNVSDEDILSSARRIFERGYDRIKMYFIMGLPTETEADVVGIAETGRRVREVARELGLHARMPSVTVSVSQHVPKPHTPFQWAAMEGLQDLYGKVKLLRELAKRYRLELKTHNQQESWLECLFARGDRDMGEVLERAYKAGSRFEGWRECFSFERWLQALADAGVDPNRYTRTIPVDARLPWDHIDIGLEPGFLAEEYRKALKGRASPPCGKPFGAKVHATTVEAAETDARRLVCYDCGIACDMSEMRQERLVALRGLGDMKGQRHGRERLETEEAAERVASAPANVVPVERLRGRLNPSRHAEDSAFKAAAEAPYCRVRLFFSKSGPMCFMGHLDLLRVIPRMLRRAGVEVSFSRGFTPQPRMSFGPALALGVAAREEVVELDLLLPGAAEDMAGLWSEERRAAEAAALHERLAAVAPPGLAIVTLRMLAPGERRIGELIVGADYAVTIGVEEAAAVAAALPGRMAGPLMIERAAKQGRKRLPGGVKPAPELVDVHRFVNTWEKTASLALRHGRTQVIDTYLDHDRIHEGDGEAMSDTAYIAWRADRQRGLVSVLVAETRDHVTALNQRARADLILDGALKSRGMAPFRRYFDDTQAEDLRAYLLEEAKVAHVVVPGTAPGIC